MIMRKKITLLIALVIVSVQLYAQIESPVKWSYAAKKINDKEAFVFIKATIDDGWHIYSTKQKDGGPVKTVITFSASPSYQLIGKVAEPKPLSKYEDAFDMQVYYFEKSVVFQQRVRLNASETVIEGKVNFMVCNASKCIPAQDVEFKIPVK